MMTRKQIAASLREGPFTGLGSYPKFWLTVGGSVLSYAAVMAEAKRYLAGTEREYQIAGVDVNYEDPALYCDETGERIPSAYADE